MSTTSDRNPLHLQHYGMDICCRVIKLYLSIIWDFDDNSIVTYKTGTQQTVNLVLDTIRLAMKQEKKKVTAELQLHSGQGFPYTSQAYFNLTQEYGIAPSMSKCGNCDDNAMAENFFQSSKQSISTETNPSHLKRPERSLTTVSISIATNASR